VLNGALYSLPYDVLNDFEPISLLVASPNVLFASKAVPAKDLKELIAWLKANPNKASVGVAAAAQRLLAAFFQKETGTHFVLVPYRGNAPEVQDLAAGQIDLMFGAPIELPLMRAGSIKAYAVTSDMRMALAPDIPTFAEMGRPALSWSNWSGLFAPRGTPREENVTGAGGTIGVGRVARASPDGYTLSLGQNESHVTTGATYPLHYDLLTDFEPVALLATTPLLLLAKNAMPADDLIPFPYQYDLAM
jgi:tripartite-type tricarboxylate transporter receptor subunit TctC